MKSIHHRARELLLACSKEIPGIWSAYEEVRADGSTVQNTAVRTRLQLLRAMREDETVLRFEYRYNGEWVTAYCA